MNEQPGETNSEKPRTADPGEDMNVRHVHAAIWREEAEPREAVRRMPILLKHFYFIMFLWLVFYLITWAAGWKWDEYEASPIERSKRDDIRPKPTPAEPSR
jgi:hypothetical protein